MHKNKKVWLTVFRIILALLVAVMIVGALLYFVPGSTPVELNLDAVKLDSDGNELDTVAVSITGTRKDYLFQDDLLDVSISPFDGFPWFKLSEDGISGKKGVIRECIDDFMQVMCYSAQSSTGDIIFCNLIFSEDFEYIAFNCKMMDGNDVTYVASANGAHTTQEVIQYFRGLVPGYQS